MAGIITVTVIDAHSTDLSLQSTATPPAPFTDAVAISIADAITETIADAIASISPTPSPTMMLPTPTQSPTVMPT
jgi:hypothetical protein